MALKICRTHWVLWQGICQRITLPQFYTLSNGNELYQRFNDAFKAVPKMRKGKGNATNDFRFVTLCSRPM